jgi:NTE family protein
LAVVFGGGGVRGAFQAGVWAVVGPQLKPDFVIGSSIGAINGWATTRLTPR